MRVFIQHLTHNIQNKFKIVLCFLKRWEYFRFNESFMLKSRTNNVNSVITIIIIVIVIIIPALHGG